MALGSGGAIGQAWLARQSVQGDVVKVRPAGSPGSGSGSLATWQQGLLGCQGSAVGVGTVVGGGLAAGFGFGLAVWTSGPLATWAPLAG